MALEIERKYLNPDLNSIRGQLLDAKATFCTGHIEENWLFDTSDRRLKRDHMLLRLRRADVSTLTLKKRPDVPGTSIAAQFKVLEELETCLENLESMRNILEALGYVMVFQYEKFRETWCWQSCTICLDALPFANAVELEGDPDAIERAACRFGLNKQASSTLNYIQLYHEHCRALGIEAEDSFLFSKTQRKALEHLCAIKKTVAGPCAPFPETAPQ